MIFRTLLIVEGKIENWEAQIERLNHDANIKVVIPPFSIPETGTYRLRITVEEKTKVEIVPYVRPTSLNLTLYPEPVDGDKTKTLSYQSRGFVREYAKSKGYDDALLFCKEGYLTEASNANFFYKYKEKHFTPDPSLPYLFGLTIESLKIPFEYVKIRPHELPHGAEIYLCNSLIGVMKTTYSSK